MARLVGSGVLHRHLRTLIVRFLTLQCKVRLQWWPCRESHYMARCSAEGSRFAAFPTLRPVPASSMRAGHDDRSLAGGLQLG